MEKIKGMEVKCVNGEKYESKQRGIAFCRKKARCVLFNASIFFLRSLFQVEKVLSNCKTDEKRNFLYGKIKFTARMLVILIMIMTYVFFKLAGN